MPGRLKHATFIPPRPNAAVMALADGALPLILRSRQVVGVEYREEDLQRLRDLHSERVAIFPNHPTGTDPAILYHLSRRLRQRFHYLCAREVFDLAGGSWGWVIRRVGAYSVVRGTPDRAAFKKTRDLLAREGMKLVIFPEGEIYSQNDSLLPFHSGITQLVFWAQDDLVATGGGGDIVVLPVALKYRFVEDMRAAILAAVARLEAALPGLPNPSPPQDEALPPGASPDSANDELYRRIRRIGAVVVERLEREYGLAVPDGLALAQRMDGLKNAIVERVAGALRVDLPEDTLPDRMRHLINVLYQVTDQEPEDLCPYDHRLWEDNRRRMQPLMRDLDRLANWIAVYDGYVSAHPTAERMADLIWRLEVEVLGPAPGGLVRPGRAEPRLSGRRRCLVRLGEPINVAAHAAAYQADKRQTVAEVTRQVEGAVQALLDGMA